MKDADGNPLVPLPTKVVRFEHLSLSPDEQVLYDLIFQNAKRTFLGYSLKGTVLNNVTQMCVRRALRGSLCSLAIITRLRQAVCHPLLVLKMSKTGNKQVDQVGADAADNAEINRLLERYANGQNLQEIADEGKDADGLDDCPLCFTTPELAVSLPCVCPSNAG